MRFLFDENIAADIPKALAMMGEDTVHMLEVLEQGAPDTEWMQFAADRGDIVVTNDKNTRRRQAEAEQLRRCGTCVVYVRTANLSAWGAFRLLVWHWEEIKHACASTERPFILEMNGRGSLSVVSEGGQGRRRLARNDRRRNGRKV